MTVGAAASAEGSDPVAAAATKVAIVGDRPILPPPETFDAPALPPAPPPSRLTAAAAPSGGVWAVIIGIDDYPGSRSDLRASVADANDVDAALAAYGVAADRRLVIRDRQATAATITAALRWLVQHSSSDATAVFFYAGHVRKVDGREAMVGADGRLVRDVDMAHELRDLAARRTWIAMAACYSGGFTEVLGPGRILTAAAEANRLAYENGSYGRSYLVEYMVRRAMIHGEAADSIEQSFMWTVDQLRRDHPNRVPVQYDQADGLLQLGPPPPRTGGAAPPPPPPEQQPAPAPEEQPDASGDNPYGPPPEDDDPCVVRFGTLVGCGDD